MKTEATARDTYQIFKNWLIINRGISEERAEVCVSNIRKIDTGLAKIEYIDGYKTEYLYRMYQDILKFREHKRSEKVKEAKTIKENIGRVFSAITDDRKLKSMLGGNVYATRKKDFKNSFILYCDFLAAMSGVFTLEDLDNGYITRERIRNVKNKPSEQLNPEFFTKGIVTALRKIGVFNTDLFSKGDKMAIGVPLDHLSEFVDVILKMHGVSTHKGVIDVLSFMQMSGGSIKSGLCDLLVTQENISIDGERLLSDDVKSILWDPETATLNLTMESDNKSRMVNLPVLSSRRSSNRILSFRIVLMIKMREQAEYLNHIRECCYEIKRSLSPFTQAMSHIREPKIPARRIEDIPVGNIRWDLTANQKENLLSETIQYLKTGFLESAITDLIDTLRAYSRTYRVELVVE